MVEHSPLAFQYKFPNYLPSRAASLACNSRFESFFCYFLVLFLFHLCELCDLCARENIFMVLLFTLLLYFLLFLIVMFFFMFIFLFLVVLVVWAIFPFYKSILKVWEYFCLMTLGWFHTPISQIMDIKLMRFFLIIMFLG